MHGTHANDEARPWVDDAQFLVLARCRHSAAISVEGHRIDHIWVTVNYIQRLTFAYIPDNQLKH